MPASTSLIEPEHEIAKGITTWKRNGFTHLRVHYQADPRKDAAWVERTKKGYPSNAWQQEYEISFDIQPGAPVFCDTERVTVKEQEIRGWLRFFGGWDFGYAWPFSYAVQIEPVEFAADGVTKAKDLVIHVLREYVRPNTEAYEFGLWVKAERARTFGEHRTWTDYGDDASKQHSDKGVTAEILATVGIDILSQPTGPGGILKRCTLFQRLISGGCVEVDPSCKFLLTAIRSGYVRDEEGDPVGGEKGHPYADACDALLYCLVNTLGLEYRPSGIRQPRMIEGKTLPGVRPDVSEVPGVSPLTQGAVYGVTRRMEAERQSATVWVPKRFDPKAPVTRGPRAR